MSIVLSWFRRIGNLFPNFDLLLLVLFVVAINGIYFDSSFLTSHDTQFVFQGFYFFYNHLFFEHSLPQWMPFEPFGIPAQLTQLRQLTPMSYLTMFFGLILGIKNVLILFKVSVILEQLVLLFGMYLLSRHLFVRRITTFFVCLAAMHGATSWGEQLYFDLRFFYMLPLTMYVFLLFFDRKESMYLWFWGLLMSVWVMGNTVYLAMVWFFIFLVMGLALLIREKGVIGSIWKQTPHGIIMLALAVLMLLAYGVILSDFQNSVDLLSRTTSGKNPLNTFLVHGGASKSFPDVIDGFLSVRNSNRFIGFMPFILFIWAMFKVKDRKFYACLLTIIALLALSFQGLFSILFYHVIPGLAYYRHLAFFYGLIKILVLIGAGYGLESFLRSSNKDQLKGIGLMAVIGFLLCDALRITGGRLYELAIDDATKDRFFSLWLTETKASTFLTPLLIFLAGLILLSTVVWVLKKFGKRPIDLSVLNAIMLGIIFIVLSFETYNVHAYAYKNFPRIGDEFKTYLYTVDVAPVDYQPVRLMQPQPGRQQDAVRLVTSQRGSVYYSSILDFAQLDMCHTDFRVDGYAKGFSDLTETRTSVNGDLLNTLGCGAPKLRLISQGAYFDSLKEAEERMRTTGNLFTSVILNEGESILAKKILTEGQSDSPQGTIDVIKFSNDELRAKVNVQSAKGLWLVYADAFNDGWQAKVDGQHVPLFKAYLFFKSIWVDAGEHEVRFYFRKWTSFFSSNFIAIVGVIIGMSFVFFLVRQLWVDFRSGNHNYSTWFENFNEEPDR